jgi:hypothetical protein
VWLTLPVCHAAAGCDSHRLDGFLDAVTASAPDIHTLGIESVTRLSLQPVLTRLPSLPKLRRLAVMAGTFDLDEGLDLATLPAPQYSLRSLALYSLGGCFPDASSGDTPTNQPVDAALLAHLLGRSHGTLRELHLSLGQGLASDALPLLGHYSTELRRVTLSVTDDCKVWDFQCLADVLGAPKLEEFKLDLSLTLEKEVRAEVEGRVVAAVAGLPKSARSKLNLKRTWMF